MEERIVITKGKLENFNREMLILYTVDTFNDKYVEMATLDTYKCQIELLVDYLKLYTDIAVDIKVDYDSWDCPCCGTIIDEIHTFTIFYKSFTKIDDGHFGNDEAYDLKEIREFMLQNGLDVTFINED